MIPEVKFSLASTLEEDGNLESALQLFSEIRNSYPNPRVIDLTLGKIKNRIAQSHKPKGD
jgi:hypothetical protein